jgi:hypothetical protein
MYRWIAAVGGAGLLALGTDACGDDEESSSAQAAQPEPVAQIDAPSGQKTEVTLDAGFVDALGTLKLTRAPVGDGQDHQVRDRALPGTGGNVTYYEPGTVSPYVQGEIAHDGAGLSLEGAGKRVELTDFVVDPGASVLTGTVTVNGEVAAESAPLFFLDGRTLNPLEVNGNGTAVLKGTTVKLKAEAAELLNQTFGVDALTEGLVIGVAKITINTSA